MSVKSTLSSTAIIIVHWDNLDDTLDCLDSLAKSEAKTSQLIIINGNQTDHYDKLKHHPLKPYVIDTSEKQLGFAENNNRGITHAFQKGATHCVLLNNDTTASENWLTPLIKTLDDQSIAFVSPKIYFSPGRETHSYPQEHHGKIIWYAGGIIDWQNMLAFHRGVDEVDREQFDKLQDTDFATGCCLAFKANTYKKIGPLNQSLFMYLEDVDWSIRAKQHGLSAYYQPKSVIWHKNAGATAGSGSTIHQYYQTRNRLKLGLAYAPLRTKLALTKEAYHQYKTGSPTVKLAITDALLNRIKKPSQIKAIY